MKFVHFQIYPSAVVFCIVQTTYQFVRLGRLVKVVVRLSTIHIRYIQRPVALNV